MTGRPNPLPDEQCFEAIKAGIEAAPQGVKVFLNSGASIVILYPASPS